MLGPFMFVFCILPVEVGYGVVSYFSDQRVGVGRPAEEEFFG
jgi:hypothetical protein